MAIVKYSPLIAEARGTVGDVVFSRNTYGAYVRDHVVPTFPNTTAQQTVNGRVTSLSQAWGSLTVLQRRQWNEFAQAYNRTNIFGDKAPYSGYNLFMKSNLNLAAIGLGTNNTPSRRSKINQTSLRGLTIDNTGSSYTILFTPAITIRESLIVYATAQLSPGINFVKSEYRQIAILNSGSTSPVNLFAPYVAKFGALPAAGLKSFCKVRLVSKTSGYSSVESSIGAIAT